MKPRHLLIYSLSFILSACAPSSHDYLTPSKTAAPYHQTCQKISQEDILGLFEQWNQSLQTGDAKKVASNYADASILLPTLSDQVRLTTEERLGYFDYFLKDQPSGKINQSSVHIGCNIASNSGIYTFTFAKTAKVAKARYSYVYHFDGDKWLIVSHHSSLMPEKTDK